MLASTSFGYTQQQPVTDLYLFEGLTINPAFAGSQVQFSTTVIHRDQWVNFPGSPVTDLLSIHSGFFKSKIGVGLMLSNDRIGIHTDTGLYGSFSYKITMPDVGILSFGLQAGFNNIRTDFNKLNLKDQSDLLLVGQVGATNPNFGAGLYFTNYRTFFGLSVPYLINSSALAVEGVLSEAKRYRYYYVYGGTTMDINDDIKLKPSTLLRFQEGAPITFDITLGVVFYETVKFGTTYRLNDNLTFLFELELLEQLHFGYAFEYTLSDIADYSNGTHEIMLNFRFKVDRIHGSSVSCPSYY